VAHLLHSFDAVADLRLQLAAESLSARCQVVLARGGYKDLVDKGVRKPGDTSSFLGRTRKRSIGLKERVEDMRVREGKARTLRRSESVCSSALSTMS